MYNMLKRMNLYLVKSKHNHVLVMAWTEAQAIRYFNYTDHRNPKVTLVKEGAGITASNAPDCLTNAITQGYIDHSIKFLSYDPLKIRVNRKIYKEN